MERLNASGSSSAFRRELFPYGFAGEVMQLLLATWQDFSLHHEVRKETRITALFRDELIAAYVKAGRSWFITLEDPLTDDTFGTELGRNDLNFFPPQHCGQTIYFTVECKRLRVTTASGFRHLADKYVTDGLQRFVDGKYSVGLPCGGMLGYVMDNEVAQACAEVRAEITGGLASLKMKNADSLQCPSSVLPEHPHSADTIHERSDGNFTVYHLLVGVAQ
ncbi:MAG: hypothetical protein ABSE73_22715 [Planctomycetota bacterium]